MRMRMFAVAAALALVSPAFGAMAAAITPTSAFNDGTSSSFGAPNRWNSGANVQDFSALRAVVPEPAAATLVGVALLFLLSAVRAGARRSA